MTERIVDFLDALVATVGAIDERYCLVEKREMPYNGQTTNIPYKYVGNGNYRPVEVDGGSVSYWRLVNNISFDVVDGNSAIKNLQATYPIRYVAMVKRDANNPLVFSQDVANVLEGRNKDLQTQLQAKNVNITVNSIDTNTPNIWSEEFTMPLKEPDYKRSLVMIDITVTVIAKRECWQDCDNYPDILQGFAWCEDTAATIDRLTIEQRQCLSDELCGNPLPVTEQVNGVTIGTAASGTTNNQIIENTLGTQVGTAANPSVVPDATVQLNGSTIGAIASGETEDFAVTQGGSPVGSWNGSAWVIPPNTLPTLSINVYSDAGLTTPITTADFGDTVYIHVTPTGITPTNYVYSIDCVTGTMIDTSASATYAFTIASYDPITIYVQAKDATDATAAFNEFSLTVNEDAQSIAFIAAHNTASGATMDTLQEDAVKGFVRLLRGVGTPHESDLLTYYQGFPNARMWILAPVSDAVVSVDGYELDLIHLATGNYVNFVSADFQPTGVNGSSTKYFTTGVSPSDFDQNSLYVGQYIREEDTGTKIACGSSQAANFNNSTFMQCTGDNSNFANINGSGITNFTIAYVGKSLGLCGVNRPSSSFYELKYSDNVLFPRGLTSNTPSTNEIYFHAMNFGGSPNYYFFKELCMYMILPSMTHEQLDDLDFAVQWYNQNIITGGRDV